MKIRQLLGSIVLLGVLLAPAQSVELANNDPWIPIGRSIDYQEFSLPGPVRAFVTRMRRVDPTVTLESSLAMGRLGAGLETVRQQAKRYDDTLNFWPDLDDPTRSGSWGKISNVVVAINGSFFGANGSLPDNGFVQSGWYAKRFTDWEGRSGFVYKIDGQAFIGDCVSHSPAEQLLILADGTAIEIGGVNIQRPEGSNDLILYSTHFGARSPAGDAITEVVVNLARPAMIAGVEQANLGTVAAVFDGQGGTPLSFDQVVLAARKDDADLLRHKASVGSEIRIAQKVSHYKYNTCDIVDGQEPSFSGAYSALGGGIPFLRDRTIVLPTKEAERTERHPRTAIAFNGENVYFIVVDGRDTHWSIGMTIEELGLFARDQLGATWAIAEDGGGSSTMVVHGVVVNNPSDQCDNRPLSRIYLPQMVSKQADYSSIPPVVQRQYPGSHMDVNRCERGVANGIMMVEVQPMAQSTKFTPGQSLTTSEQVNLRVGPGTNYASLGFVASGAPVTIEAEPQGLNGVFATGYHWWRVNANGTPGWMVENYLR